MGRAERTHRLPRGPRHASCPAGSEMLGTQGCVHSGLRLVALCWATSPQTSVLAMLCRGGSLAQETRGAEMCDGDRATLALQLQRVLAPQQGGGTPLADKSPPAPQKSQG